MKSRKSKSVKGGKNKGRSRKRGVKRVTGGVKSYLPPTNLFTGPGAKFGTTPPGSPQLNRGFSIPPPPPVLGWATGDLGSPGSPLPVPASLVAGPPAPPGGRVQTTNPALRIVLYQELIDLNPVHLLYPSTFNGLTIRELANVNNESKEVLKFIDENIKIAKTAETDSLDENGFRERFRMMSDL